MMMMNAEDLVEERVLVPVREVRTVPAGATPVVVVVHRMDEAEVAQMVGRLHVVVLLQEADAVVLLPQEVDAALPLAMEDVAGKKVVLLQADEIYIKTIKGK